LKIGDQATGTSVLSDLYAKWKDNPVQVDLASMWKELGIVAEGRSVRSVEDAPLAAVRRAITAPHASKPTNSKAVSRPQCLRDVRLLAPVPDLSLPSRCNL